MDLEKMGLLSTLHTYKDVSHRKPESKPRYPYCLHVDCCGRRFKRVFKPKVSKFQRRCPDCGHQLSWITFLYPGDEKLLLDTTYTFSQG